MAKKSAPSKLVSNASEPQRTLNLDADEEASLQEWCKTNKRLLNSFDSWSPEMKRRMFAYIYFCHERSDKSSDRIDSNRQQTIQLLAESTRHFSTKFEVAKNVAIEFGKDAFELRAQKENAMAKGRPKGTRANVEKATAHMDIVGELIADLFRVGGKGWEMRNDQAIEFISSRDNFAKKYKTSTYEKKIADFKRKSRSGQ